MDDSVPAYVGIGANLGNRLATMQRAVDLLAARDGIAVVRSSRVYETEPVGGPEQPTYLNAVLELRTRLAPRGLLDACLHTESLLGRERHERWGPRTVDLDVLAYDATSIDEPDLQIPHPRLRERAFVIVPLTELDPDPSIPGMDLSGVRLDPGAIDGVRLAAPPLVTP